MHFRHLGAADAKPPAPEPKHKEAADAAAGGAGAEAAFSRFAE